MNNKIKLVIHYRPYNYIKLRVITVQDLGHISPYIVNIGGL